MNAMCLVCHEPNKFRMQTDSVDRIVRYLSMFVDERNHIGIEDRQLWSVLSYDSQHVHIMCGVCPKINKSSLQTSEDRLRRLVYQICMQLEEGVELPCYDILSKLQGHYPLMYREVNKRCHGKKGRL